MRNKGLPDDLSTLSSPHSRKPILSYLLGDTSGGKCLISSSQAEKTYDKHLKNLKSQEATVQQIKKLVNISEKWEKVVKNCLNLHFKELKKMNNAALFIQKMLKGCMTRAKYCNEILTIKENVASQNISDLKIQTYSLFTLGNSSIDVIAK